MKSLIIKIIIGIVSVGTVGTGGLIVASKIPATAPTIKSIPVVGQYIDVVTFNKGLSEEEFNQLISIYDYHQQFLKRQQWIQENYPTAMKITEVTDNPNRHWILEPIGDNQELSNKALDEYSIFTRELDKETLIANELQTRMNAEQAKALKELDKKQKPDNTNNNNNKSYEEMVREEEEILKQQEEEINKQTQGQVQEFQPVE